MTARDIRNSCSRRRQEETSFNFVILTLGKSKAQLISKAEWRAIDSSKKRTEKFDFFAILLFVEDKSNSSVLFLEESTARQSAFRN